MQIKEVKAREILDSRGWPTIEVSVKCGEQWFTAAVPSGASTGKHEVWELRDGGNRFLGKGVLKAVDNVNKTIFKKVVGYECTAQREIDELMIKLDGTENKSNLGGNSILGVSMAVCKVAAIEKNVPLYEYIKQLDNNKSKKFKSLAKEKFSVCFIILVAKPKTRSPDKANKLIFSKIIFLSFC